MLKEVSILEVNLTDYKPDPILDLVEAQNPLDVYIFKAAGLSDLTYVLRIIVPRGQEKRFTRLLHEEGLEGVLIQEATMEIPSSPSRHLLESHGRDAPISGRKS